MSVFQSGDGPLIARRLPCDFFHMLCSGGRESAISTTHEVLDRNRLLAISRTCRLLRHDLAAPLSAAALHLEVANRGLGRLQGDSAHRIHSSVKTSQREVEYAAWMIDILSELARGTDEVYERFDLGGVLGTAMERARPELRARGLRLVAPSKLSAISLLGNPRDVEQALTDVLAGAAVQASPGDCRVSFERTGGEASVRVSVGVGAPAPSLESLFRLTRRLDGAPSGFGLFLARWTFESLGGRLEAALDGQTLSLTATTPAGDG
jgi:signal transduction histidine kinase